MKKIMIVDDSRDERELLILYLKSFFESMVASNKVMPEFVEAIDGQQAWSLLTKEKIIPDLMIIDFQMPGMNGVELIEKIKGELKLNSEIVLHSGWIPADAEARRIKCKFVSKIGGQKKIFDLASELGLFIP
jgi:CheY-like chemotaxis protein